jgi:hypothetical protein
MELVYPWDLKKRLPADPEGEQFEEVIADKWVWHMGFLTSKNAPDYIWEEPESSKVKNQIKCLTEYALGSRRWVICLCESSAYMRSLYPYVMATYVLTTSDRAIIADVDDLIVATDDHTGVMRDTIEYSNLLLIPYADPNNSLLKYRRGTITNIMQRRKANKRATVVDLYINDLRGVNAKGRFKHCLKLVDSFGQPVFELFTGDEAKHVVVKPPRE